MISISRRQVSVSDILSPGVESQRHGDFPERLRLCLISQT
nr:hypothetical protein [Escherichia coli]